MEYDIPLPIQVKVIGPALDLATFAERKSTDRTYTPTEVYASSLHLTCNRQLGYPLLGVKGRSLDRADWLRNASTGSSMHENYQKLMLRLDGLTKGTDVTVRVATAQEVLDHAGLTIYDFSDRQRKKWSKGLQTHALELPLPKLPERISGRGDGIFRIHGKFEWTVEGKDEDPVRHDIEFSDELVVVEIKTVKHKDWTSMPKNHKYKKFYAQMQAYMHFYKLNRCILFVVNRNDDSVKEFILVYNPQYMEWKLAQIVEMWSYVDRGLVPPATFDKFGDCFFCPFAAECDLAEYMNSV